MPRPSPPSWTRAARTPTRARVREGQGACNLGVPCARVARGAARGELEGAAPVSPCSSGRGARGKLVSLAPVWLVSAPAAPV